MSLQYQNLSTVNVLNLPQFSSSSNWRQWALDHRLIKAYRSLVHLPTGDNGALDHRLIKAYRSLVHLPTGDNGPSITDL